MLPAFLRSIVSHDSINGTPEPLSSSLRSLVLAKLRGCHLRVVFTMMSRLIGLLKVAFLVEEFNQVLYRRLAIGCSISQERRYTLKICKHRHEERQGFSVFTRCSPSQNSAYILHTHTIACYGLEYIMFIANKL